MHLNLSLGLALLQIMEDLYDGCNNQEVTTVIMVDFNSASPPPLILTTAYESWN